MNKLKNYFLLFLSLTILASCKNDDDKPDEPNYGIEYFECKINGEPFQAVSILFQCSGPVFDYYPEPFLTVPEGYMVLAGIDCPTYNAIGIRLFGYNADLGTIDFFDTALIDSISAYYRSYPDSASPSILYERLINGLLNVEQLVPRESGNSPLGTIKGTFEFTVSDEQGIDTIRVTEGRFRFDVPQIF